MNSDGSLSGHLAGLGQVREVPVGPLGVPIPEGLLWRELDLPDEFADFLEVASGSPEARPLQVHAFRKMDVLRSRKHLIVSAPTSSGKTLVGLAVLLSSLRRGSRAILVEPMRAIAEERADWVRSISPAFETLLGGAPKVSLLTGDYDLELSELDVPTPACGEIIIATPERLFSLLHARQSTAWLATVSAICVDEAQVISDPQRGPCLEFVITSLLSSAHRPRIALLTASVGDIRRAKEWLNPCDVVIEDVRSPELNVSILDIGETAPDDVIDQVIVEILKDPSTQIIVFVYTVATAKRIAARLERLMPGAIAAYHGQLEIPIRRDIRERVSRRALRCVVATTALAYGVNFPATHVLIYDTAFGASGKLRVEELMQMMGRAGRSRHAGTGLVLLRANDSWRPEKLAAELQSPKLRPLVSALSVMGFAPLGAGGTDLARFVLSRIVFQSPKPQSRNSIHEFLNKSLCGTIPVGELDASLRWLADERHRLAVRDHRDDLRPTELGKRAIRSMLPLQVPASFAALIRDLLVLEDGLEVLGKWRLADTLIVLNLLHPLGIHVRFYSRAAAEVADGWVAAESSEAPVLFSRLIRGTQAEPCLALLGSLNLVKPGMAAAHARRRAYVALFRAAAVIDSTRNVPPMKLIEQWEFHGSVFRDSKWKKELLWLLRGVWDSLDHGCFEEWLLHEARRSKTEIDRIEVLLDDVRFDIHCLLKELSGT